MAYYFSINKEASWYMFEILIKNESELLLTVLNCNCWGRLKLLVHVFEPIFGGQIRPPGSN